MTSPTPAAAGAAAASRAATHWLASWWHAVHLGALLLALALSPSSYRDGRWRLLARHMVQATGPAVLWFTVVSTLISLVLIRIVLVTALSYGLSQYALEMVVRVLVLELIPLTAALFAALRTTIPYAAEISLLRERGRWQAMADAGDDPLREEVLPRVGAGMFCAMMLCAVSCVVTLVVAYLSVYGPVTSGFAAYTHTVGQVFNPAVSTILALKMLFFAATVALMPIASVLDSADTGPRARASAELRGLLRMFVVILLIEAGSLVGNYY